MSSAIPHERSNGRTSLRRFTLSRRAADESGFALAEVLVSAVLLVLIALGIFSGVDGASGVSGLSKSRSVASSLAQQDLDRVRGLRVSELATLNETNTKTANSVPFTVVSTGQWVNDSTGTDGDGCAPGGSTLHYVKAVSTVTWPTMGSALPVRLETLVPVTASSYGSQGNLAVRIRDRAGNPITSQSVTATGPGGTTRNVTTSSTGCAYFGFLPTGLYNYSFSRPGYVDTLGTATVSRAVTVNGGATVGQDVDYDQAGQIRATFETVRAGATTGSIVTAAADASALYVEKNVSAPSGTWVPSLVKSVSPAATSITTDPVTQPLYPFTTPYLVWAGNCTNNRPPTGVTYPATVVPGAQAAVTVRVPALNIRVTDGTNALSGVTVKITPTGSAGCVPANPAATTQVTTAAASTVPAGALPKPGFPWGAYTVCAQRLVSATNRRTSVSMSNTVAAGTNVQTIAVTSGSSSGLCP